MITCVRVPQVESAGKLAQIVTSDEELMHNEFTAIIERDEDWYIEPILHNRNNHQCGVIFEIPIRELRSSSQSSLLEIVGRERAVLKQ